MRVLIAGKNGQLASALAALSGVDAIAQGRDTLDISDQDSVARAVDATAPDVVVNAAAYTAVDKAETEENAAFAVNELGPRLLAEATAERGVPIIHVSTDYVFSGTKSEPYTEDDPVAPMGVYGKSKLAGEEAVQATNPKHVILRTAWVYSATGHNFVKTMLRLAGDRDQVNVVDDQYGNPTYAPHLAAAILDVSSAVAAPDKADAWGIYHLAGTGATTWCGLAREVFAQSKAAGGPSAEAVPISTADYPTPAARPANSRLDCGKAGDAFGIAMPPWQDGVKDCVARLLQS